MANEIDDYMAAVGRYIFRLENALKFYAEADNWQSPSSGFALQYDPQMSPIRKDAGSRARAVLRAGMNPEVPDGQ